MTGNTSSDYHVQHIERLSRATHRAIITCNTSCATWYEGTAQLLCLTDFKSHFFELFVTGRTINRWKEGRKPEYQEKTPDDELQKMPHTTARIFKPQPRLESVLQHWWQGRKADVLTITSKTSVTVCLLVGYLTSQQHTSVSQRRICSDNFTCCHTEIEFADQPFYLIQSQ